MRQEQIFISESIGTWGGWVNWRVECVTFADDGGFGPFGEIASGATQSKLGARFKVWRWRRRFRREAAKIRVAQPERGT